ncbi:unnamed protein product [Malus baccata var. baccata]
MCLPFVFGGQLTWLLFPCFPCNILVECIIFDYVAAISSFKQQVEGLQDIDHSIEILVRLLCAVPGLSEKNVQVVAVDEHIWLSNLVSNGVMHFDSFKKIMKEHKNPKVLSEGVLWMVSAVEDFGVAHMKLKNSNKNLVAATLTVVGTVASAMGAPVEKFSKSILSDVLKCLGDNKKHMRQCTLTALDSCLSAVHLDKMVPYITAAISDTKLGAEGWKDLVEWLTRQLSGLSDFSDAAHLLKPASSALTNDISKYFREDVHRRLLSTDFKKQVDGLDILHKFDQCPCVCIPGASNHYKGNYSSIGYTAEVFLKKQIKMLQRSKIVEVPETIEQCVVAAAAMRFSILIDSETDAHGGSSSSMSTRDKHDALELDEEFANNEVVIWRANFEEFIHCLRHKACVENVRARLDDGAALVLRAMLMSTGIPTIPVSFSTIYEEVINSEAGRNLTCDYVKASLSLFCNAKGYLKKILELAQNDEVESIVLKRYGRDAYKMFRLLSTSSRALEMDKISDMTLVEKKEIPTILYKLWKDGGKALPCYMYHRLAVTGARQAQFLVWKVDRPIVWKHILDEMFHTALNLSLRLAYEDDQIKEVRKNTQCYGSTHKRTGPLGKQWQRFRNVVYVMHAS